MQYLANGAGTVLAVSTVTLNAPVAATALFFNVVFNVAAHLGRTHAQKLEEGCKREHYEQGKKDAAATASGTTNTSTTDPDHHDTPTNSGRVVRCGEMWIPGYVTEDENGIHVTSGKSVTVCPPIIFDLDGDGIEYRTLSAPILTDTDADGRKEQRAWVGADDGLLFWDANADGLGQHEETVLASFVEGAHTDLEALHAFDSNDDGRIDSADTHYNSLKVGRDFNQNGFFEANEVFSLAQLAIARIDLVAGIQHVSDHEAPVEKLPGVYEFHTGQFVRSNGTVGRFADAALAEQAYSALAYSSSAAAVVSYGGANAFVQKATGAVSLSLTTASYAGYSNLVDFIGNAGNDNVTGSAAANILYGGGGADTLLGLGGDDTVFADAADLASGNLQGGDGYDSLVYSDAASLILDASSRSFELVKGGTGNDRLTVSASVLGQEGVLFIGDTGNDWLQGAEGNDTLIGGAGIDSLLGGNGDDVFFADYDDLASGTLQGGAGFDTIGFDTTTPLTLDLFGRGFEIAFGGSGNDYLYTSSTAFWVNHVYLYGEEGNDILVGGAGHDFLVGGAGADTFTGGAGDDVFVIDRYDALSAINGGGGSYEKGDTIVFDDSTALYIPKLYSLNVRGAVGGTANDTVYASRTDSDYWREKADNFLAGGPGSDYLYGGAGRDVYTWNPGDGADTFHDRDYGETRGDVVHLGEGVAPEEVTIESVQGVQTIYIGGIGAGSVRLIGFALGGAPDKLVVGEVSYDLTSLLTTASGYGTGGILLTTRLPASYGTGGGGTGGSTGGSTGGGTGGYTGGPNEREPPILFDLDGDGFELIAPKKSGIYFDWNDDGLKDETGWAGPDDGFLVLDRDGDGDVDRADEISFGAVYGKKEPFVSDLEGLRVYDTDGNGSLDGGDADFGSFAIWKDGDSDAAVDPGELLSLAEIGLIALALDGYLTGEKLNGKGNVIYATTDAVFTDNSTIRVADVLLGYDAADSLPDVVSVSPGSYFKPLDLLHVVPV
jgi:Ca2+-binding RTX toxin-like protein